jgi:stearoyl-CoA desaturase (Delta-9 desaturase)
MDSSIQSPPRSFVRRFFHPGSWPFWGIHLVAIVGVVLSGFSWAGLGLALAFYATRMLWVSIAYHRYFSHRTFKTSRVFQFVMAVLANTTAQKGVLWWAGHHRRHHKYSDQPGDTHSPVLEGLWFAHVGWVVEDNPARDQIDEGRVKDLTAYPELRFLERINLVPALVLALILLAAGGWHAVLWGFFVSTVLLWHGTFTVNSLNHMFGRRRYQTTDDSRNNWFLAIFVTAGEGWHNNHHHYQAAANQGFRWYEIDAAFYFLMFLRVLGLVWDVRVAPKHVVRGETRAARAPAALSAGAAPTNAVQSPERR